MIKHFIFIGVIDDVFSLVQYQTKLFVINHESFGRSLFYQLALIQFGDMGRIIINNPVNIANILKASFDTREASWMDEESDKDAMCSAYTELLKEKSTLLNEYFRISIDENGYLCSIPNLLRGYYPMNSEIPFFLLRLATDVDWETEISCFVGILNALATLYSCLPSSKSDVKDVYGFHDVPET